MTIIIFVTKYYLDSLSLVSQIKYKIIRKATVKYLNKVKCQQRRLQKTKPGITYRLHLPINISCRQCVNLM